MSDANGYDITKWNRCLEIMDDYGIEYEIKSENILLTIDGSIMGGFYTINDVFYFLTGYSQGFEKGLMSTIEIE